MNGFFPDIFDCKEPCFTNFKVIWSFSEKLLSCQLTLERTHSLLTKNKFVVLKKRYYFVETIGGTVYEEKRKKI